ncbi:MAG: uncharacterized protein K0Q50_472 [Vampirovibrio sp.]|jgi:hypothetical protein|nr:uncharacterized protein [Vampirovibrio sp.]
MKPLSATSHGVLDYLVGILLIVSPWLFGFNDVTTATYTMLAVGIIVVALSAMTNYPLGLVKAVSFPAHGKIETVGALFLLASPWIARFPDVDVARNLAIIVALAWLGVVALTNYSAYETRRPIH